MISSRAKPSYCCSIINKVSGILDTQVTMAIMAFPSKYHLVQRNSRFFASSNAAQGIGACTAQGQTDGCAHSCCATDARPNGSRLQNYVSTNVHKATETQLPNAQPLERSPPPRIFPDYGHYCTRVGAARLSLRNALRQGSIGRCVPLGTNVLNVQRRNSRRPPTNQPSEEPIIQVTYKPSPSRLYLCLRIPFSGEHTVRVRSGTSRGPCLCWPRWILMPQAT